MNKILNLKGNFKEIGRMSNGSQIISLPKNQCVKIEHLNELKEDLSNVKKFWEKHNDVLQNEFLVTAYYTRLIPKSHRLKQLLKNKGCDSPNESVVGVKYSDVDLKHIITYRINMETIDKSIEDLELAKKVIRNLNLDSIDAKHLDEINTKNPSIKIKEMPKSRFAKVIVDSFYVEKFNVENYTNVPDDESIVSLYNMTEKSKDILKRIGIDVSDDHFLYNTTVNLTPEDVIKLKNKAPYLISMAVSDISNYVIDDYAVGESKTLEESMPLPTEDDENNVVGVIDTVFDDSSYFHNWVDSSNLVGDDIPADGSNQHGTEVTSIIVDGPTLNPKLDDGCGRFKVKHFGVTYGGKTSSFKIVRNIEKVVKENPSIKVWNLSLGSPSEIKKNFMSPEGYVLDKIQSENDVIFIVAGTNDSDNTCNKRIGAPADSINSIVVNAVSNDRKYASYSRKGPVLSFYNKPDVSYFGGDASKKDYITVCDGLGSVKVTGTSFAAPWITRKVAYLVYKLDLSREEAKALIVDSAAGWKQSDNPTMEGFGIVPQKISDVIQSKDDEIKFYIRQVTSTYKAYAYNLPVPLDKNKYYPYVAKVTLCYFSDCNINQGVDYSTTELNVKFGRIKNKKVLSINKDHQAEPGEYCYEKNAKNLYRKWDNMKHIQEKFSKRTRAKKSYESNTDYGVEITTNNRFKKEKKIPFGLVITLKNINGDNELDTFVRNCEASGWFVQKLNVENRLNLMSKANVNIDFD